ncbi:hypothetical protein SEUCBS139899_005410 [Sporothrix eucalyptigena]|uniref:Uncharacterized protein n=1 Tax=Sporothrix eucalyptigena TaxID=1812306 RepID=A0ABP0D079_9PEZI
MSPVMMATRAASPMLATSLRKTAGTAAFSTGRVLRNTVDNTAARRGGLLGLFPRRMGWGGALVLFSLGVADGTLSTTWYLSRNKE